MDDLVTKTNGVSGKKQELLVKVGITPVQGFVGFGNMDVKRITKVTKGLGVVGLTPIVDASR